MVKSLISSNDKNSLNEIKFVTPITGFRACHSKNERKNIALSASEILRVVPQCVGRHVSVRKLCIC